MPAARGSSRPRRARSRSPSALCISASALPRCSAGHVSDTSVAPLAHSPPIPRPSPIRKTTNCVNVVARPQAAVNTRVEHDARHQRARAAESIRDHAERHTAGRGGEERDRSERTARRGRQAEILSQRRKHERKERHIERVEHPAKAGREHSAPAFRGSFAPPAECRAHRGVPATARDRDTGPFEARAKRPRQRLRAGRVAVRADRVHVHREF